MATEIKGSNMPSNATYGRTGFSGPSSDVGGKRTISPLAADLESRDPALAQVRAKGAGPDNPLTTEQLRTVSGSRPVTFGHKPSTPSDSPKIPGSLDSHSDLCAKPRC